MRMGEGKRRVVRHHKHEEMGEIRKGPWKVEEDEVLISHVKKYGPRDWSSIRSKGLLQRTGKSCRLRWVNKLRPNLKSGVKFSAEEERTVIDLQAQFGNKWARIATYLPGRTDNDVKNFWSSRQKRLARILQNSSAPNSSSSSTKSHKNNHKELQTPAFHDVLSLEAPKLRTSTDEESATKSCSSSHSEKMKILLLPELLFPNALNCEQNPLQMDCTPPEKKPFADPHAHLSYPSIPQLQSDFSLPLEGQDFMNTNFLDVFGNSSVSALDNAQLPMMPSLLGPDRSCPMAVKAECLNSVPPDSFIDDYPPMDMFDHIESLPSPSEWS